MKDKIYTTLFAAILILNSGSASGQFQYDADLTAEELIADFFNSGVLLEISNITFNGVPAADTVSSQLAYFNSGNSAGFNIDEGILMSTGFAPQVFDPDTFSMNPIGTINLSDPDILMISQGVAVNDCAIIEFDVVVDADAVAFSYVFASNEYPAYTCSQFNDAFGLFISGPGIDGPFTNSAENIATIPDSDTPIAINTVNSGVSSGPGNESNCEDANPNWLDDTIYFVDNSNGDSSDVNFPGYTVNLEAYKEIIFGEQYHFKFAICDVIDGALDSGVFLEAGSFEGRLISDVQDHLPYDLKLYPNPAKDEIRVESDVLTGSTLQVFNIYGKLVKNEFINAAENIRIDISDLDAGIYILRLSNQDQILAAQKLVVK
jgi:hypothetical protein